MMSEPFLRRSVPVGSGAATHRRDVSDKVSWSVSHTLAAAALVALAPGPAQAQEKLTAKAFDAAVVKDFHLEGNAIPVQTRNTVVLKGAHGCRRAERG